MHSLNSTNMKNLFIAILILPLFSTAYAGDEREVKSKIKEVTVFLKGAQVTREGSVALSTGNNEVKFIDLAPGIDPNSIQVKGGDNLTIISVNYQTNYLSEASELSSVKSIKGSLEALKDKKAYKREMRELYKEEKSLLLTNKNIKGSKAGVDVDNLVFFADYLREHLTELELLLAENERQEKILDDEISRLNRQLKELKAEHNRPTGEIMVKLSAKVRTTAKLRVSYVVRKAGWIPTYDIRAKEVNAPIALTYKAKVFQNTGQDWNKIKINLSTGNPSLGGSKPAFSPWVLRFESPNTINYRGSREAEKDRYFYDGVKSDTAMFIAPSGTAELRFGVNNQPTNAATTSSYTNRVSSNVNTEFKVKIPYTILSDGKKHLVEIQEHKLPAEYAYYTAPKFDKDAFLLAKATGWDELSLLPGNASIYYQGTYVGQSYINTNITKDTLKLSMGRDKGIVVERKKVKDFSKTTTVGSSKKTKLGLEISIRNNRATAITIDLEDQVPISKHKEVEIELLEKSGAKHNPVTGKLEWKVKLAPGETKTYKFTYSVKYPKDKVLGNL
jgi:uncharacterized protein (TIGR02231 family)